MRPQLQWQIGDIGSFAADAVVVNLFEGVEQPGGATGALDEARGGAITRAMRAQHFRGKLGETLAVTVDGPAPLVLVAGLGSAERFDAGRAKRAAAHALRRAAALGARRVGCIAFGGGIGGLAFADAVEATLIGGALGAYRFTHYRPDDAHGVEELVLVERAAEREAALRQAGAAARAIAHGVHTARDLVNLGPNDKYPEQVAQMAAQMARETGLACEIMDRDALAQIGAGGILAVGRGSAHAPCVLVLRHDGGEGAWHGLLGKGVTFDAGGLDLKSADGMLWMKGDMAGAAATIGAMEAIARLGLPGRFVGVAMLVENMTGADAFRPGDVLRMLSGKTVEVHSTDAEGRLILADGVELMRRFGASDVVDLATLTGAQVVALGHLRAALFGNNEALLRRVEEAAARAAEGVWRMPFDPEYGEALRSEIADIRNVGGRPAGAITAAHFIGSFADGLAWAHLDVAGLTLNQGAPEPYGHGGTGFGVQLLARLAQGD